MSTPRIIFRVHAIQRMFERNISVKSVVQVIHSGEMIEDYSSEMPEPSRLLLGFQGKRPVHVVASESQEGEEVTIITAYLPHPRKWNKYFTGRRS